MSERTFVCAHFITGERKFKYNAEMHAASVFAPISLRTVISDDATHHRISALARRGHGYVGWAVPTITAMLKIMIMHGSDKARAEL